MNYAILKAILAAMIASGMASVNLKKSPFDGLFITSDSAPYMFSTVDTYICPKCHVKYRRSSSGIILGCAVIHGPNECCHYGDVPVLAESKGSGN